MIRSYFLLAFRTFLRNKVSYLINLIGMAIALGCCITAWVNYDYNAGFDSAQPNAPKLYRIAFWEQTEKGKIPYGVCPLPAANLVSQSLMPGDGLIRYISKGSQFRIGDEMFAKNVVYADPSFTDNFTIDLILGSKALKDKSGILISDKLARTYFNSIEVVGKSLAQIVGGQQREFVISGVYKEFPGNSSFRFDLLTTFDNYFIDPAQQSSIENDWARWTTAFLYIQNPSSLNAITKQLNGYVNNQNEARRDLQVSSFYVEPFVGMASRAVRERNQGHWMNMAMPPAAVVAPFAMAGFLLLVACFNFMNNSIALAGSRLKEIGIRKVIGGRRKSLIAQFLSETLFFCLLSTLMAVFLATYFVAGWNGMWSGIELTINYFENPRLIIAILALVVGTALLAGAYPALYISRFEPIKILRGTTRFKGATFLSKTLLVIQFSISLAAVIFALAFYFNSRFQKEYDLGYSYRTVIQVPLENGQFEPLYNALARNPKIKSIGGAEDHIFADSYKAAARTASGKEHEVDILNIGEAYFETVDVRVIEGRGFQKESASDYAESIIVNEEFLRSFDFKGSALGQRITINDSTQVYIVGVVKDVYLQALFQPLTSVIFRYVPPQKYRFLLVSADPGELIATNSEIKQEWKKLFPALIYPGRLMEQDMVMALEHFDSVVILYSFMGIVAIVMSVAGLYSMVSLSLQRRTKELGIRKILGASITHVVVHSSRLFVVIMLISFIVGSLMGWAMVNSLMGSIWEYYVPVGASILGTSVCILLTIASATIGLKIRNVVVGNPVDALRYE